MIPKKKKMETKMSIENKYKKWIQLQHKPNKPEDSQGYKKLNFRAIIISERTHRSGC